MFVKKIQNKKRFKLSDTKDTHGFVDAAWTALSGFGGIKWLFKDAPKRHKCAL